MDFSYINTSSEQDFNAILQLIKLRKNGVVADTMATAGLEYSKAWGVSIPHLRIIAKNYLNKHTLAQLLWQKKWRETMILASMIEDAQKVSSEQLLVWLKDVSNIELAEQLSFNLFSRMDLSLGDWSGLLPNQDSLAAVAIFKGLYRLILQKRFIKQHVGDFCDKLLKHYSDVESPSMHELVAVAQIFAVSGRTFPEMIKSISVNIHKFVGENPQWLRMEEIIETEFTWLDE